jgi:opacity protein-like surface antigen
MKSVRIVMIVFFGLFSFILNGQVFIGGNFGLNTSGGSFDNGTITVDKTSSVSFSILPMVGIFLSENVAVGASVNLSLSRTKFPGTPETINTSSGIGVSPFLRYYAIRMDKFSVFGQGNIGFSYSGSKSKVGGTSTDGPKATSLYLNLVPGLSYDLSDRLSLETSINVFNLGVSQTITKQGSTKDITTNFGIGGGLYNIVTIGDITIGAIYKF